MRILYLTERTQFFLHQTSDMDEAGREAIVAAALAAVHVLDGNGLYGRGSVRPDRFPSNAYSNWTE